MKVGGHIESTLKRMLKGTFKRNYDLIKLFYKSKY